MVMMPVIGAVEAFLAIWSNLPYATLAFFELVLFFAVLAGIIVMIFKL